ncbi:MAG: hypothetical protein HYY06_08055 [Deltaproteobacteria bacterium]|nr:hypothetical protein [Deltaproteobacteria bacterium]
MLGFCGLLWSCGGDVDPGARCSADDECADDQECTPIAFGCLDSAACASTCELTCATDDDCGGDQECTNRNGHLICAELDPEHPGA